VIVLLIIQLLVSKIAIDGASDAAWCSETLTIRVASCGICLPTKKNTNGSHSGTHVCGPEEKTDVPDQLQVNDIVYIIEARDHVTICDMG
jgi:hypothetical protein